MHKHVIVVISNQMDSLPTELIQIVRDFLIFKPTIKHELKQAVDLWCDDKDAAKAKYGEQNDSMV